MKQGQTVSQCDLINDGWQLSDFYGNCEIWAKGNSRLLWNPISMQIQIIYYEVLNEII